MGIMAFRRDHRSGWLAGLIPNDERMEMATRIYELQNEVKELRKKLANYDVMQQTVERLLLENVELHRQIESLKSRLGGKPAKAQATQPDVSQLDALSAQLSQVQASLTKIETQIAAAGGENTSPVALLNQRDSLRKDERRIEDAIDLLHSLGAV